MIEIKIAVTPKTSKNTKVFRMPDQFDEMYGFLGKCRLTKDVYSEPLSSVLNESMKFHADTAAEEALIKLLPGFKNLMEIEFFTWFFYNLSENESKLIEQNLIDGKYQNIDELIESIRALRRAAAVQCISLYSRLSGRYINDKSGPYEGAYVPRQTLVYNFAEIQKVCHEQYKRNVFESKAFTTDPVFLKKIIMPEWSVECLFGIPVVRVDCYLAEELTESEIEEIKKEARRANAGRYEEVNLQKRKARIRYGSFSNYYTVYTYDEFEEKYGNK